MSFFIFERWLNLGFAMMVIGLCLVWMCRNKERWLYLFPVLFGALHYLVYYSAFLMSYYGVFGLPFSVQFFLDWSSLRSQHILISTLLILVDMLTDIFRPRLVRLGLMLFGGVGLG